MKRHIQFLLLLISFLAVLSVLRLGRFRSLSPTVSSPSPPSTSTIRGPNAGIVDSTPNDSDRANGEIAPKIQDDDYERYHNELKQIVADFRRPERSPDEIAETTRKWEDLRLRARDHREAFISIRKNSPDERVRFNATLFLISHATTEDIPLLIDIARAPEDPASLNAIRALHQLSVPEGRVLAESYSTRGGYEGSLALKILSDNPSPESVATVRKVLRESTDRSSKMGAIHLAQHIGTLEAAREVIEFALDPNTADEFTAQALSSVREYSIDIAIPTARSVLASGAQVKHRNRIIYSLGQVRSPDSKVAVLSFFKEIIQDRSPYSHNDRIQAIVALGKLDTADAAREILNLTQDSARPLIASRASSVLNGSHPDLLRHLK